MEALFKAKDSQEFLKIAYKILLDRRVVSVFGRLCNLYDYPTNRLDSVVLWMYKLGRDYHRIPVSVEEFRRILFDKQRGYYYGQKGFNYNFPYDYGVRYWDPKNFHYRVSHHFVFTGQKKKEKSDWIEWRKTSGLIKDQRKAMYKFSPKKHVKRYSWRKHRQFERQALRCENYDAFHGRTWKEMEDIWSWD